LSGVSMGGRFKLTSITCFALCPVDHCSDILMASRCWNWSECRDLDASQSLSAWMESSLIICGLQYQHYSELLLSFCRYTIFPVWSM
jgi:hypothetical protein